MKRRGRPRRRSPNRKRNALRAGALVIGLLAAFFLLADRGGLDRLLPGVGPADVVRSGSPGTTSDADRFTGHVTRIVDGDTFWISGQVVRIRVWGLDAPKPMSPVEMPPRLSSPDCYPTTSSPAVSATSTATGASSASASCPMAATSPQP